ncbi:TRAP transporter large permease [Reyranella sp.]|uniref:TRAP transporter large permease n=1 Tax=Reyranella sp. TaxID=1929291 RepID=UPI002730371E|nr:TRAP transporter large permease subunit [Reyranella sp.]MDP2375330.1 TRAP transporter large permease subunit [Reyranella sp.]
MSGEALLALVVLGTLFFLLASGVWIGVTLLVVGFVALFFYTPAPAGSLLASTVWDSSWGWALTALPLFIWMGEILFRSRLSEDMFKGLAPWLGWLPGRLLHVNILGCGVMAAVSGSSSVTCATIGRMSMPELRKRGYDEGMSIGTLAGSGTLGLLIPPSIMMIVYGITAQVSIGRLFIAGFLPGFMMIGLFMAYTAAWSMLNPTRVPADDLKMSFGEKLWNARRLIPVILLIIAVLGSIYGGIATPTEAAVMGVVGALVLAAATRTLSWESFRESLLGAVRTSCLIGLILVGAAFVTMAMAFTGLPASMANWVNGLGLSPIGLIVILTLLYMVLGCFLDGVSMIVLTAPVVLPMVAAQHIDPLWFGIYIVLVVEMAQITPPVGFNLFVLQNLTGRDIWTVTRASTPFFLLLGLGVVLITAWPDIVLALPRQMIGR